MRIDKDLLLASPLMDLVVEGKKVATVRFGKRDIENHNSFRIIDSSNTHRYVYATVANIKYVIIGDLSEEDLHLAGKEKTPKEYLEKTLHEFYPTATLEDEVTIITFEIYND